jgi:hypothetical protein
MSGIKQHFYYLYVVSVKRALGAITPCSFLLWLCIGAMCIIFWWFVEVWKCVGIHMHIPKVLQFTGVLQINHSTFWDRLGLYLGLRTSVAKLTLVLVSH